MAIEALHHRGSIPSKHWFRLDGNAIGSGQDCEQQDLHSAAINGILSGLVSITAGEKILVKNLSHLCSYILIFWMHAVEYTRKTACFALNDPRDSVEGMINTLVPLQLCAALDI